MIRYLNGKLVAVKKIKGDDGTDEKYNLHLLREIYFGYKLEHENLVKILGIYYPPELIDDDDEEEDEEEIAEKPPHIVMEYCGENLYHYLDELKNHHSSLTNEFKRKIILEVAKGLKYLHERNLVHRDLKVDFYLLSNS